LISFGKGEDSKRGGHEILRGERTKGRDQKFLPVESKQQIRNGNGGVFRKTPPRKKVRKEKRLVKQGIPSLESDCRSGLRNEVTSTRKEGSGEGGSLYKTKLLRGGKIGVKHGVVPPHTIQIKKKN